MTTTPYLTMAEAAEYLRINVFTLLRWHREGRGPPRHRRGKAKQWLYRADELEKWQEGRDTD